MTHHRFNLLNSSFQEIEVNKDNYKADMSGNEQYKANLGYSLSEIKKKLGFGEKKSLKWLKMQKREGKVRIVRVPTIDITERLNYTTVYIFELEPTWK